MRHKKEENDDMEDRFTPEGIPVRAPVGIGIKGIFNLPLTNQISAGEYGQSRTPKKEGEKSMKQLSLEGNRAEKENVQDFSLSVVIILILLGGLSWL